MVVFMTIEVNAPVTPNYQALLNGHFYTPESIQAEEAAGALTKQWQIRNLTHAYQPREPLKFLVDGLLPCPCLAIVYGGPGSLKSMLLADMAICIASGRKWLEALPDEANPGITFRTEQAPVLWIDFDNGTRRTDERIDAFAKTRELPDDTPIHYVSMPTPWLDASLRPMIEELAKLVKHLKAKLIIIDNLGLVTGDVEENSGGMSQVMGNLRWLCEDADAAVIVVHHQRKSGGASDAGIRKGKPCGVIAQLKPPWTCPFWLSAKMAKIALPLSRPRSEATRLSISLAHTSLTPTKPEPTI